MNKAHQINLITAGSHPYGEDLCISHGNKFVYSATLSTYVYEYSSKHNEYVLSSIICNSNLITSIAFHPHDQDLLVLGSENGIVIWNIANQKQLFSSSDLKGTPSYIQWNMFDVNTILYCLNNTHMFSWNFETNHIERFKPSETQFSSPIVKFRFHPKILKLAFAHENGTISIIYLSNKKARKHILKSEETEDIDIDPIIALEWDILSNDYLLVAGKESGLRLLDSESLSTICIYQLPSKAAYVRALSWISDAPGLFVTGDNQTGILRVWSVSKSTPIENIQLKKNGFKSLSVVKINQKSQIIRLVSNEGVHLNDEDNLNSKKNSFKLTGDNSFAIPRFKIIASFSDGGTGLYDSTKRDWDFFKAQGHLDTVFDCKFSINDNNILATASFDGTIKLWSIATTEVIDSTIQSQNDGIIYSCSWAPGNVNCIAAATNKNGCFIWDWDKKKIVTRFKDNDQPVYCVAWNLKDSKKIAYCGGDFHCTVRQLEGINTTILVKYKHPDIVYGCEWSPTQKEMIATACRDQKIRVFYLTSPGNPLKVFCGHTNKVFAVRWSPLIDGMFCSSSDDCKVMVWDYSKDDCVVVLQGHTQPVRALCWNSEISFILLSGSWDSTIRIWDIRNGSCLEILDSHIGDVYGLTIHPSRPFLVASASRDSTIRLWDISCIANNLQLSVLCNKPWSEIMNIGENCFKNGALPLLVGRYSKEIKTDVPNTGRLSDPNAINLRRFIEFFSPHTSLENLWNLVDVNNNVNEMLLSNNYYNQIVHWKHITKGSMSLSNELLMSTSSNPGVLASQSKLTKLNKIAELYLKTGNITKYCEIMIELNQWERALGKTLSFLRFLFYCQLKCLNFRYYLAIAPSVSIEYWQSLMKKYVNHLDTENSPLLLPYAIANGNIDRVVEKYMTNRQYKDAIIVSAAFADGYIETNSKRKGNGKSASSNTVTEQEQSEREIQVQKVYVEYANWYFDHADPIRSACCHLAISDHKSAILQILRGNMLELVLCLSHFFDDIDKYTDIACQYLAIRCEKYLYKMQTTSIVEADITPENREKFITTYLDLALELINMIKYKELKNTCKLMFCCHFEGTIDEINRVYTMFGFPSFEKCCSIANELDPNEDLNKFLSYQLLSNNVVIAVEIGKKYFNHIVESKRYTYNELFSVVNILNSARTTVLIESKNYKSRMSLVCMSTYVGLLAAIRKGYNDIIPGLFRVLNNILKNEPVEITLEISQEEIVWNKVNLSKDKLNNEEQETYNNLLAQANISKQGEKDDPDNGYVCVPGSNLPNNSNKSRSFLTDRLIKGSEFDLEDNKTVISLNEAIMWARVTPFSPLCTGFRINPF